MGCLIVIFHCQMTQLYFSNTKKMKHTLLLSVCAFILSLSMVKGQQMQLNSIIKGETPSKYIFQDMDSKERSLDEFKGKFVLIDVWASWCYPCLKELPALDTLRQHYKNQDLVVVGISVDSQHYKWDGVVKNLKIPSYQFFIDEEKRFEKEFDIRFIPRMILLDPDGNVYNERMPKPSNPEIYKIIDEALSSVKQ